MLLCHFVVIGEDCCKCLVLGCIENFMCMCAYPPGTLRMIIMLGSKGFLLMQNGNYTGNESIWSSMSGRINHERTIHLFVFSFFTINSLCGINSVGKFLSGL